MILSYSNNWFARRHNEEKEDYKLKSKKLTLKLQRAYTEKTNIKIWKNSVKYICLKQINIWKHLVD